MFRQNLMMRHPWGGGGGPSERECHKRLRRPAFLAGFLRKVTLKSAHFSMCNDTNESLYCQLILEYNRNVFFLFFITLGLTLPTAGLKIKAVYVIYFDAVWLLAPSTGSV